MAIALYCLARRAARALAAGSLVASALGAAQSVTAPTLDSATLRARLGPTMARPGRPMPADTADLDAMLAQGRFLPLLRRLTDARDPQTVLLDLNWEQRRVFDGAGFLIASTYLNDLWRAGSSLPGADGEQMKQSAGMMLVYALTLVRLDGVRCADVSAPGHRQDQLIAQNRPLLEYIRGLRRERQMTLGTIALAIEGATAPARPNDAVLCSGGLDEIIAGLTAQGDRPLPRAPATPDRPGRTYLVPSAPGYAPAFVAPRIWLPKQAAIRASLPAALTAMLSLPDDTTEVSSEKR